MAQNASSVAEQQTAALDTVLQVLARHDNEASLRIAQLFERGARKWSVRSGVVDPQDEILTMLLEVVASLSKQVDKLQRSKGSAFEQSKPRPRGRPPKAREQEAS